MCDIKRTSQTINMKYLFLAILICNFSIITAQTDPRSAYEEKLKKIAEELKVQTDANFGKGPMFNFEKPYTAVVTKESEYSKGIYPNVETTKFIVGDTILVLGAKAVGSTLKIKGLNSDEIYETKPFGRPSFQVMESDLFESQIKKIKKVEWQQAETIAAMLECGALEAAGKTNFEKHHLNIGDTPVFFDIRLEQDKVLVYFDLRTYSGTDFKDVGEAIGGESTLGLSFGNGKEASILCESDDSRFAIFDLTNYREDALTGISKINLSLSKKEVSKELLEENQFAIGLKMQCIKG